MPSYIPSSDADFFVWQKNFITFLDARGVSLGSASDDALTFARNMGWRLS